MDETAPTELPIDGVLDLHTFQPNEVKRLVPDYLDACREKGICEVRIIHGKGTGTLRRMVHAILERYPFLLSYRTADENAGSWGATLVLLQNVGHNNCQRDGKTGGEGIDCVIDKTKKEKYRR